MYPNIKHYGKICHEKSRSLLMPKLCLGTGAVKLSFRNKDSQAGAWEPENVLQWIGLQRAFVNHYFFVPDRGT